MNKLRLKSIIFLILLFCLPTSSQVLKLKDDYKTFHSSKVNTNSHGISTVLKTKRNPIDGFFNLGFGLDPSAYIGYNMGITINYHNIIDARLGLDGYSNIDVGGNSKGYSLLTTSIYSGGYVYEDKLRMAIGAGIGFLMGPAPYGKGKVYPYISGKIDHYFGSMFGIGAEVKIHTNHLYSNSSFLYFLNFNFRQ